MYYEQIVIVFAHYYKSLRHKLIYAVCLDLDTAGVKHNKQLLVAEVTYSTVLYV